jgi:hypothetical protein
MIGSWNILKFNRIKADFNKSSLEIEGYFCYPFDEFVYCAERPARLPLPLVQVGFGGIAIKTEKEAA